MSSVRRIGPLFWYQFPARSLGIYRSRESTRAHVAADSFSPPPAALLDGPMFHGPHCSGAHNVCFGLFDQKAGLAEPSELPRSGMTIAVLDGQVAVSSGGLPPAGSDVAVQLYPSLVRDGQNIASRSVDSNRTWRAALVVVDAETLAFVLGQSLSMHEFAERLVAAGARAAGYTDGGGSASLWTQKGRLGAREDRPVPSWLVAKQSTRFPIVPVLTGAAAIAAALAAWWWSRRATNPTRRKTNVQGARRRRLPARLDSVWYLQPPTSSRTLR